MIRYNQLKLKSLSVVSFITFVGVHAQETHFFKQNTYEISKNDFQYYDQAFPALQSSINDVINFKNPNETIFKNLKFRKIITDLSLYEPFALSEYEKYVTENPNSENSELFAKSLGNYYLANEDYENAAKYLSQVSTENFSKKEQIEHDFKLGYAYFANEDFKKALQPLKNVNESGVYKNETNYMIGHILYSEKRFQNVMNYFEPLLNETDYAQKVRPYLIQIYFNDKKYDKAIEEGRELLSSGSFPEMKVEISKIIGESYFQQKKYSDAGSYLETYLNSQEKPKPSDYYQLGYVNYLNGNYEKAVNLFNKITSENSEMGQNAYYQLGNSYLKTNQKNEALTAFKSASEMDFNKKVSENAMYNYSKLSFDVGNPFEATPNVIQKFIKKYPKNANQSQMQRLLIKSYVKSNNYNEALTILNSQKEKTAELKEVHQEVAYLNGINLYNENKFQEAVASFQQGINQNQNQELQAKCLFWQAEAHTVLGNFNEALLNLKTLEKLNVNYSEKIQLPYSLGFTYLKNKNFEKSIEYFEIFLKNPKEELKDDARLRLAEAYIGSSNYEKALEIYNSNEENGKVETEDIAFQRGVLYGIKGENSLKIKSLEKFVKTYPSSEKLEQVYLEIGNAYYEESKFQNAIDYYSKIINSNKQNDILLNAYFSRADSYAQLNQTEKAITEFQSIAKRYEKTQYVKRAVDGAKPLFVKLGKLSDFENWISKIGYSITSEEKESLVLEVSENDFKTKNYAKVIEQLNDFEQNFSKSSYLLKVSYLLAESYYQTKQEKLAEENFTKVASKANDNQEDALFRLSQIYLKQNRKDKAIFSLEALNEITNNLNFKTYSNIELMNIYAEKKQFEKAEKLADEVLVSSSTTQTEKENAELIKARAKFFGKNETEAKELYKTLEKSKNQKVRAESLYYKAYFLFLDKKYKQSNEVIFDLVSKNPEQQYWGAKSLVLMSKNYHFLNDDYQSNYTIEQVLENYQEFPDVIEEAKKVKDKKF